MSLTCNDENFELCNFLKKLVISIEKNELKSEQLQIVGEFIMKYKFNESDIREREKCLNIEEINNNKEEEEYEDYYNEEENDYYNEEEEENNKDVLKFLILGWYIYKHLLDK